MIRKADKLESEIRRELRGGKGDVKMCHFFKQGEIKSKCRLCARLILPPGASIGMHKHETEDEVFIVERGSGLIDDGQGQNKVGPGDAILTGNGAQHSLINNGKEDLSVIAVIMCY